MVHHHDPVARCVDIELDSIGPQLQGSKKGRDGILRQRVVRTAV
jgi:hypothetical protein